MKEQLITTVMEKMDGLLNRKQRQALEWAMAAALSGYKLEKESHEIVRYDGNAEKLVERFLTVKHLAGCSDETIKTYRFHLQRLTLNLKKPLLEVETNDIRSHLAQYKELRKVSNTTLENMRLCFSSFFTWLNEEGLIAKNPMSRIQRIKADKTIKKPFTEEELEKLRMACTKERDLAILEFLYSSGARVSEAVKLNKDQIDFINGECVVYGKGAKERVVYLNPKARIHLKRYLSERTDDNPALFVGLKTPHERLSKEGIEASLRKLGADAGVKDVHPHRFRRTMATNALNRGMPLQEVKEILGHEKMDTTMIYCTVMQDNVKLSHKKYVA